MPSLLCKPQSGLSGAALDLGIIAPGGVTAVSVMERWKVDVLASDLVRAPSPTHVRTYVRTYVHAPYTCTVRCTTTGRHLKRAKRLEA
jgi:hypothetical protein